MNDIENELALARADVEAREQRLGELRADPDVELLEVREAELHLGIAKTNVARLENHPGRLFLATLDVTDSPDSANRALAHNIAVVPDHQGHWLRYRVVTGSMTGQMFRPDRVSNLRPAWVTDQPVMAPYDPETNPKVTFVSELPVQRIGGRLVCGQQSAGDEVPDSELEDQIKDMAELLSILQHRHWEAAHPDVNRDFESLLASLSERNDPRVDRLRDFVAGGGRLAGGEG